jgi:hypothetical protein
MPNPRPTHGVSQHPPVWSFANCGPVTRCHGSVQPDRSGERNTLSGPRRGVHASGERRRHRERERRKQPKGAARGRPRPAAASSRHCSVMTAVHTSHASRPRNRSSANRAAMSLLVVQDMRSRRATGAPRYSRSGSAGRSTWTPSSSTKPASSNRASHVSRSRQSSGYSAADQASATCAVAVSGVSRHLSCSSASRAGPGLRPSREAVVCQPPAGKLIDHLDLTSSSLATAALVAGLGGRRAAGLASRRRRPTRPATPPC